MARPDAALEGRITRFAEEVQAALGSSCTSVVLHGSAAGDDWVADRSDLNTAIVVTRVTPAVLDALAPVIARWRAHGFAAPLVMDPEYLDRARDTFPMELDDIRARHRVLAGRDPFTALEIDPSALRRECEREARGKLLRLRALYLEAAAAPERLEGPILASLKSFLIVLRHVLRLHGHDGLGGYEAVLDAAGPVAGALPVMRRLLARRKGDGAPFGRGDFAAYLGEVERIVAAVDALDG